LEKAMTDKSLKKKVMTDKKDQKTRLSIPEACSYLNKLSYHQTSNS